MGGIERTSNKRINPYLAAGAGIIGLAGLGLGASHLLKAYDKYKFLNEASKAMASPILQMTPL